MKAFVKSIARRFGYDIRKIAPPPSAALADFIDAREASFETDFGDARPPKIHRESSASPVPAQTAHSLILEGWQFQNRY